MLKFVFFLIWKKKREQHRPSEFKLKKQNTLQSFCIVIFVLFSFRVFSKCIILNFFKFYVRNISVLLTFQFKNGLILLLVHCISRLFCFGTLRFKSFNMILYVLEMYILIFFQFFAKNLKYYVVCVFDIFITYASYTFQTVGR